MSEVKTMADGDLLSMLLNLKPSDEAVAMLAAALVSDDWVEGVTELRRRYMARSREWEPASEQPSVSRRPERAKSATSVAIDRARWNHFWFVRRTPLNAVGPMVNRCEGLASVIGHKGSAGFYTLDAIACEIGMTVDDLIYEVGTDAERERLCVGRL